MIGSVLYQSRFSAHFARFLLVAMVMTGPCLTVAHAQSDRFEIEGYGIINYQKYNWQTDPQRRATVDIERVAIEPSYQLSDRIRLEGEIEFEHGGTGASMEFDKFEEFGEYEQEIEKGGEVVLEKIYADITVAPWLTVRVGHFYVPVGLTNSDYEPTDYFTVNRSEAETSILPATWHETGVQLYGTTGPLTYRAMVVNGLDATGFSSSTWVALGHQGRFEMINAEDLAVAGRLDFEAAEGIEFGASGYFGNSANNRPKPDLTVPANVGIGELHGVVESGPFTARVLALYGALQNAGAVSKANRNLSNNLNVKRSPVGSAALGWYAEAGFDLMSLFPTAATDTTWTPRLDLFGRYEFYDTMFKVDEEIHDNPRWERHVVTAGINLKLDPKFVLKGAYSHRSLGTPTDNREDTYSLGMGFEF
jgi:hypothetical protein